MSLFNLAVGLRFYKLGQGGGGRFILQAAKIWKTGNQQCALSTSALVYRSSKSREEVHPGYIKIRKTMEQYQIDDGVPIHLKAGGRDRILFGFTLLLMAFGLYLSFKFYYDMIYPKKPGEDK